jgi:hypothetical protein
MATIRHHDYRIEPVYQKLTESLRDEIIAFWMNNAAVWDSDEARERVDEVAVVVLGPTNKVVGVSSVFPAQFGADSEIYLNYRMFIQRSDRVPGLMKKVVKATRCYFDINPELRHSARGMLIFAENPKVMRQGIRRMFERSVWEYAGQDQRGLDIWRYDFVS